MAGKFSTGRESLSFIVVCIVTWNNIFVVIGFLLSTKFWLHKYECGACIVSYSICEIRGFWLDAYFIQNIYFYELCLKSVSLVGLLSICITMQKKICTYSHLLYCTLLCTGLYIVTLCTACCCVLGYISSRCVLRAAVYWALYRHVVYCVLLCTWLHVNQISPS